MACTDWCHRALWKAVQNMVKHGVPARAICMQHAIWVWRPKNCQTQNWCGTAVSDRKIMWIEAGMSAVYIPKLLNKSQSEGNHKCQFKKKDLKTLRTNLNIAGPRNGNLWSWCSPHGHLALEFHGELSCRHHSPWQIAGQLRKVCHQRLICVPGMVSPRRGANKRP